MKKTLINQIQTEMSGVLNNAQRQKLCDVLEHCFLCGSSFFNIYKSIEI